MALMKSFLILILITLTGEAVSYACSLTEDDMVELRRYVRSKCENDLVVSEEVFGFGDLEGAIREASTLGGNLAVYTNQILTGHKPPESKREFSRLGAFGGRLHMASIVSSGGCHIKFDKSVEELVKMDLPDQMQAMNIDGKSICNSAEKKLKEFQETQFSGECSNGGVVAFPEKKVSYRLSRAPAGGPLKAHIRSTGDPTAAEETRRPISVDMGNMQITYSLPFVGKDGKLLTVSDTQKTSVEDQIRSNLEEFIQMHDCCTIGPKSEDEKKICNRYNLKYTPKKATEKSPTNSGKAK